MEFIAMVISSAVSTSCAFHTITLYRGTIDASLKFIAVLSSWAGAIWIAGAVGDRSSGSGSSVNASLEFIAVLTSWAGAIWITSAIRDRSSRSGNSVNASLEFIAMLTSRA